jgi:hypothetical protein
MKINIEAILAAKREEQQQQANAQDEAEKLRLERRIKRRAEQALNSEQELREHALFIEKCISRYDPNRLHGWFKFDNWTVSDAMIILCGYDAKTIPLDADERPQFSNMRTSRLGELDFQERRDLDLVRRLDGLSPLAQRTLELLNEPLIDSIMFDFEFAYQKMRKIWDSGTHAEGRYPPKYFIDWAVSKEVEIEWLDWARAEGYYGAGLSTVSLKAADEQPGNLATKSEAAYLNIIGALTQLYWAAAHPGKDYSQSSLLAELSKFEGYAGLSERNLKDKLTKAMRAINSTG